MSSNIPLAERLRPKDFNTYFGQKHLVGENGLLRKAIEKGKVPSMILWGPPGVGKTTLAQIISNITELPFYTLSAVSSGVKDVRATIELAQKQQFFKKGAILFIDEIHRFSKSQQDSLLAAVEQGIVTLIGATTENPSFEVITPLLSRCQVYVLKGLDDAEILELINYAVTKDKTLSERQIEFQETEAILLHSGGDARKSLNIIDLVSDMTESTPLIITNELVQKVLLQNIAIYDKDGEMHYDVISAFIKSVRGSDPDAALYYLARMLEGGEDLKFIARRLLILAAEDVGLANPNALLLAQSAFEAVTVIGYPESRLILSEVTVYLATSPKSNSTYLAIDEAIAFVKKTGNLPVPLHLRNAPTRLMKELNYGTHYKYPHGFEGNFIEQNYLPDDAKNAKFYKPGVNQQEVKILERLKQWWKKRY
jgi:putative ATPase